MVDTLSTALMSAKRAKKGSRRLPSLENQLQLNRTTTQGHLMTQGSVKSHLLCHLPSQLLEVALQLQAQHLKWLITSLSFSRAPRLIHSLRELLAPTLVVRQAVLVQQLGRPSLSLLMACFIQTLLQSQSHRTSSLQSLRSVLETNRLRRRTSLLTTTYASHRRCVNASHPATLRRPTLKMALKRSLSATRSSTLELRSISVLHLMLWAVGSQVLAGRSHAPTSPRRTDQATWMTSLTQPLMTSMMTTSSEHRKSIDTASLTILRPCLTKN